MRVWTASLLLVASTFPLFQASAEQKRIYLAPDDHTDYVWTADAETYRASFIEMLDYYIELADKTKNEPKDFQSRWNADGSFWIWTYEHSKPPAAFTKLIDRVRDGHISFPLNTVASTYGGTPTEAVLRGMYYAGSVERRYGLRIPLATAMENQTLPYGLGALWAGSGAQYSWRGICGCLTKIPKFGARPHDIYWWKGDDGSRILIKWNALTPKREMMGNYLEARHPAEVIAHVESDAAFKAAYPYDVIGIFGKGGDDLKTESDEFVTVAKQLSTPRRKVIVSNINDFFGDFQKTYGQSLPEFSASFGNEWDLYTASVAELSARVRRAVEKLRAAEAMASLVTAKWPEFLNGRKSERDQAWVNLGLYWEHDWTADGPITREQRLLWGRKVAGQIESYVDGLYADSATALSSLIANPGQHSRFYVFNPLSWTRTTFADIRYSESAPVHVVDLSTDREVPSQVVVLPEEGRQRGNKYLRIAATDVPSVGYKVFEVRSGPGQQFESAANVSGNFIENDRYRVKVDDNGAIRNLIDKSKGNRELVGHSLNDLGPDQGSIEVENEGPVSVSLKATAQGPLAHVTRITLFKDLPSIDIRNDINQNFDGTYTWTFDFKFKKPDVWSEEVGAVIRAKMLSDGGQYSPTMSRLEWLTLNHFVDMSDEDGGGVTLSNSDAAFMKLGESSIANGVSYLDTASPRIRVLAGGQIDGPAAGIPRQGGDSHFLQRFALTTHSKFDPVTAMKFALEHQNPVVTGWLQSGSSYPAKSFSFFSISNPNVLLWALKPAEENEKGELVARVWNLATSPQDYSVSLTPGLIAAQRVTHIETPLESLPVTDGSVRMHASRSQLQTIRLRTAKN